MKQKTRLLVIGYQSVNGRYIGIYPNKATLVNLWLEQLSSAIGRRALDLQSMYQQIDLCMNCWI